MDRGAQARGYRGNVLTYSRSAGSGGSPYISSCLDNSPASGARGVLACFIEGDRNRAFFRELPSASARRAHVLGFVGASLGDAKAAHEAINVVEHNWADEPYIRGAYMSYFSPGSIVGFWPAWRRIMEERNLSTSMRRLWIAGADYDAHALGYIEGAIRSGQDAAARILAMSRHEAVGPCW